jgi:hypothetical protein
MFFASRLGVRYIWIDSLCIKQRHAQDWLSESANMHRVYGNSFCNFSATAAKDSGEGLFFAREVHQLWDFEANLNTEGIPGRRSPRQIQTCAIIDPLFWEQGIDNAVLNSRGWVLQERIMAPRVLHFCKDQIAWECHEGDAAERYPDGVSSLRLSEIKRGEVVLRNRLKGLDPGHDGKALRVARLKTEPVPHLISDIYAFELWKRIVEVYSKARLTNPKDKLIALTGIAKMMSGNFDCKYVAGMWERSLAAAAG